MKDTDEVFGAKLKGDSLYVTGNTFRDTIFTFSPTQKAKRINGFLVISYKDSVFWKTNIVSLKNDSLTITHLVSKKDYLKVRPLVKNIKTTADTAIVSINPTRKEFKKILELKGLGYEKGYKKVK